MPFLPILLSSSLFTQGPPPPRQEPPPSPLLQLAEYLKLDADQLSQAKAKLQLHQVSLQTKRKAAQLAHVSLDEALRDPSTSEARLRELHEKAAAARYSELSEVLATLKEQVALLTPEQATKFKAALPLMRAMESQGRGPRPERPEPGERGERPQRPEEGGEDAPPPFRAPHRGGE